MRRTVKQAFAMLFQRIIAKFTTLLAPVIQQRQEIANRATRPPYHIGQPLNRAPFLREHILSFCKGATVRIWKLKMKGNNHGKAGNVPCGAGISRLYAARL